MPEHVLVGIDLGATQIRMVASGGKAKTGQIHWSRRVGARAPTLADLPRFLRRVWRRWGLSPSSVDALVVAAKGVWTVRERQAQQRRLGGLAKRVQVISDAEAAFLGALGDRPGVLVLAGTGSIVLGRDRRRRWARAGGLGPLLGDEGSGFWIGREWLRLRARGRDFARIRKLARSPDAVRRVAGLAPAVLRRAERGHRAARAIVANSQALLAALACRVARDLRLPNPVAVSWAGSLLENRAFRAGVWRALKRHGIRTRVMVPAHSPINAAHALAKRLADGNLTPGKPRGRRAVPSGPRRSPPRY